ncbi:MAG: TonB-dependent receptor, partial [Schleiferiaceae bacterium]|nr:TonB-dependent receptor [Schleiferiaceae bacterium]
FLPNGITITSKFNYQRGIEEDDQGNVSRSRHAAPAFGITRIDYKINKLQLQWYAMYSAAVSFDNLNIDERIKTAIYATDENGNPFSPSWLTLNFKALYQLSPAIGITAGIENLTDKRYRPYSSGLVAPGRNFILSLRTNF